MAVAAADGWTILLDLWSTCTYGVCYLFRTDSNFEELNPFSLNGNYYYVVLCSWLQATALDC